MSDLKSITKIVKSVLEKDKASRGNDNLLYLHVLECWGVNIFMPMAEILSAQRELGIPPFESVRRARQKLQAKYPELRACEAVEDARAMNEEVYREYARADI